MLQGIDVSHWQGAVDWKKVAGAGFKFCFLKATQGSGFVDKRVKANVAGAKAAGLYVGLYHYFTPTGDAGAQFGNFWATVLNCGGPKGLLVPVLDVEGDNQNSLGGMDAGAYAKSCLAWLSYLKKKTGRDGIVYTYPYFAKQLNGALGEYPLWIASYPKLTLESGKLTGVAGWDDWCFWQWSNAGRVAGVGGSVDMDSFNGDEAALRRLVL